MDRSGGQIKSLWVGVGFTLGGAALNYEDVVNVAKLGTLPRYICGVWV